MTSAHQTLTKFEKTWLLNRRAQQLKNNEFVLVQIPPDVYDLVKIAEIEMEAGKLLMPIDATTKQDPVFDRDGDFESTVQTDSNRASLCVHQNRQSTEGSA